MELTLMTAAGKASKKTVEVSDATFGRDFNESLVHQAVVAYMAGARAGTRGHKNRAAVSGGGKKPWRQKGTGRARAGTIRSPLWRGGGTVFGPSPRLYGNEFPRKMKRLAMKSVLSDKARSERIKIVDQIELPEYKTKAVASMLVKLDIAGKKCLIVDEGMNGRNDTLVGSCRNLQNVTYSRATLVNGYEVLDADWLIMTKAGLEKVQEVFS